MKKIVFTLLYSFYIIRCEYPFINKIQNESMQSALKYMLNQIEKINFVKNIKNNEYNKITIEHISKIHYYFHVLYLYIINLNDLAKLDLINFIQKKKGSFNNSLLLLLNDILYNPAIKKKEPIFELLHLAIGPGLTLLDFIQFKNEEDQAATTDLYNNLLNSMLNIYTGEQTTIIDSFFEQRIKRAKKEEINPINQEQALFYAQQIYATMNKHKLTITTDLSPISHKILSKKKKNHNNDFFHAITNKLKLVNKKITQKTKAFTNNVSSYKEFLYDYNFHADIITLLLTALTDTNTFKNSIIQLVNNISLYLDTVKDCALLDSMEERKLILHYKNALLLLINNYVLNTKDNTLISVFNPSELEITKFSDERMLASATFINKWINETISWNIQKIQLKSFKGIPLKDVEEKTIAELTPSFTRILLFYADILQQAYQPAKHQWKSLTPQFQNDLLKTGDNIFKYWQLETAKLYTHYLLNLCSQKNITEISAKKIVNFTFWFTDLSLIQYSETHYSKESNLKDKIAQILERNLHLAWYPKQNDTNIINTLQKQANDINFITWYWRFMNLINKKDILDIVKGSGISKTLTSLNKIIDTFFNYNFNTTNPKMNIAIKNLIENMNGLNNSILDYLKKVAYKQKATSINKAYIKTGKALINAVQKTINLVTKKLPTQQLIPIQNLSKESRSKFDFTSLDKQFASKKAFI